MHRHIHIHKPNYMQHITYALYVQTECTSFKYLTDKNKSTFFLYKKAHTEMQQ